MLRHVMRAQAQAHQQRVCVVCGSVIDPGDELGGQFDQKSVSRLSTNGVLSTMGGAPTTGLDENSRWHLVMGWISAEDSGSSAVPLLLLPRRRRGARPWIRTVPPIRLAPGHSRSNSGWALLSLVGREIGQALCCVTMPNSTTPFSGARLRVGSPHRTTGASPVSDNSCSSAAVGSWVDWPLLPVLPPGRHRPVARCFSVLHHDMANPRAQDRQTRSCRASPRRDGTAGQIRLRFWRRGDLKGSQAALSMDDSTPAVLEGTSAWKLPSASEKVNGGSTSGLSVARWLQLKGVQACTLAR